ncbi:FAD-binding and (Fe-S)-binding domain-containing protein [Corynebacterium aquilae]|nr:FAD-binding and (Fe-S)-binding domain-containing protein [Corynebacterium aquilae]
MATRAAYVSDASIYRRVPQAVVEPRTREDIQDCLQLAQARGWDIIARGGGTSVAGNSIGQGLIIDTSRHFCKVLEIDSNNRIARVEPGIICDRLREAAAEHGLTYGPDPSTHSRCSVGGMVANNACGSHSVAYGTAADNLHAVSMLLADGREVRFFRGGCTDVELTEKLRDFVARHEDLIRSELGRFPRQVSGYGLHYLLPERGFDVAKALAGSEGTLGIFTELEVNLVKVPRFKALVVCAYTTVFDAAADAPRLILDGVGTVEGMGGDLLAALRSKNGQSRAGANLPGERKNMECGGWLYCEVGADSEEELHDRVSMVVSTADCIDHVVVTDPVEAKSLWHIREASAGTVTRLPDGGEAWPSWEDSAVPATELADYLRGLYTLMDKYQLQGIPFGHFGEGCVHVRISFDFDSEHGRTTFHQFMTEAADLVASHGGSLSGEHGDGRARSALLGHMYSDEMLAAFAEFKSIFDPDRRFNPGVLVNPDSHMEGIRPGGVQRQLELTPTHSLPKDGGSLVNAVNRCVGVGACRSMEGAMCPSFQITGDEVHSTRGRARVLNEMMRGELLEDGYHSDAVNDALDLCLSCKACASECPVNVDMATYKSEVLNERYRGTLLRPRAHYTMGWLPLAARFAHSVPGMPRLVGALMRTKITAGVLARVGGLDPTRELIDFAPQSAASIYRDRVRPSSDIAADIASGRLSAAECVILWPDSFNNYLDVNAFVAAVEVLDTLGYTVMLPKGSVCCGLTWHSTGQLSMAQRIIASTARTIRGYLELGLPVLFLEPSCLSMIQHEAPQLVDDPVVQELSRRATSWAQFVSEALTHDTHPSHVLLTVDNAAPVREVLTQVHCHERSMGDHSGSTDLLRRAGFEESTIQTGCCGMAGNWGFEPGHAKMSMELGERELFPRARAAETVCADGFSCRTQVRQGTSRRALHTAELVRDALRARG